MLRVLGAEKYKSMQRIQFIAGRRVLRDSRRLREEAVSVSRCLKAPVYEIGKGALELAEKYRALQQKYDEMVLAASEARAKALVEKTAGGAVIELLDEGMDEALRIGKAASRLTGTLIVIGSRRDLKFTALASAEGADIRPFIKEYVDRAGGRGGGGSGSFQGSFSAEKQLEEFIDMVRKGQRL
jgi:alanyl-tRNA synthetase